MKKYTLFGTDIIFDDAAERAYELQINYEFTKSRISTLFQNWYKQQDSIQDVLKNFPKFVHQVYHDGLAANLFEKVQEYGIYDMTLDMYERRYISTAGARDALERIEARYDAINEKKHAEEEYRASRKASRGRWQGGGFGLGGALKGAATAGALNAVSGLGHDLANSAGNFSSAIDASNAKSDLYKSNATRSTLLNGIQQDIRTFYDNHIALLSEEKPGWFKFCFDEEHAEALFENAKNFPDKREELLKQSFERCPWNEELQKYIFINYPENRREILRASTDFGVGIYDCVEELLQKEYTDKDKVSEEAALKAKARILKIMEKLGVEQTRVLNQLEIDCLHRLCPNLKMVDEAKCNLYIEAVQAYDAQEQNKEVVLKEIKTRVDEIWSAEDDVACKMLYLNTDIHNSNQIQDVIKQLKDKSRTNAHEPYVKALEDCSEGTINRARRYQRGILPKVYASLAWAGLPLAVVNAIWIHAGNVFTGLGIAMMVVFGIMYTSLKTSWDTLTIDGSAVHVALTTNNPSTEMKVPAPVLSISVAGLMLLGLLGYHTAAVQWEVEAAKQAAYEARVQEYEANKAAEAQAAQADEKQTDTAAAEEINIEEYTGHWNVDMPEQYGGMSIDFTMVEHSGCPGLTVSVFGAQEDHVIQLEAQALIWNSACNQAAGSYVDSWSNIGTILLDFEDGEMYLSISADDTQYYDVSIQHVHCTKDLNGVQEESADPEIETHMAAEQAAAQAADPSDTLYSYVYGLNDAINTGSFDYVASTLLHGSSAYNEQQSLVAKLYGQNITENVVSCEVKSQQQDGNTAVVVSNEVIGVTYSNGSYQEISQSYAYHMQLQSNGSWLIDTMAEQ